MTDKVSIAIQRLQTFCPPEGYWLAFSGGKDSIVIKRLADMAGVPYDAHFNVTTVDPPEVLRFIRQRHADVIWERPEKTMWQLIVEKRMPPTRLVRYCCEYLKECGGIGRIVVMGIRWADSKKREKRRMTETCYKHVTKTYVNPIIDWSDKEVWEFIRLYKLPYCRLYDEGFNRIGCVLCPNAGKKQRLYQAARYPGYYKAYLRAFGKMLEVRQQRRLKTTWQTPQEVMDWWLEKAVDPRQLVFSIFD